MSHTVGLPLGSCRLALSTRENFTEEAGPALITSEEFSLVVCFLLIFCFPILFQAKIFQMPLPYSYFIQILGMV